MIYTRSERLTRVSWACALAALLAMALAAACGDGREPVAPSPPPPPAPPRAATIEVVSGNGQRADAGAALPELVVVRVADAGGSAVAGATVAFTPGQGGGAADPAEAASDAEGVARTTWTLGAAAGRQTLVASVHDRSVSIEATANNPDRAALEAFYEATGGSGWENSENWLTDAPLGEWYGVAADRNGRVVELSLWFNGLSGRIPPDIGRLTSLASLVIGYNSGLSGSTIPPELGKLQGLMYMTLNGNGLTGSIPPEPRARPVYHCTTTL